MINGIHDGRDHTATRVGTTRVAVVIMTIYVYLVDVYNSIT